MLRFRSLRPALAAGLLVAAVACNDTSTPSGPDGSLLASRGQGGSSAELPSAAELDRQVPGFGGFFLDRDGNPTIYLARGADRGVAERALAGYLGARGLGTAAVHVLQAKYSWQQLERWQTAATLAAFEASGTVFVDNDETSNRVKIGVADLNAMGQVQAALARSGLPDDAVIIERTDPIVQVASLQNVVDRPVRAGVQINFPGYLCSVGFNATSGSEKSFITASHCTNTQGGVESTPYWQPLESSQPTQIATEVADPVYTKGVLPGCPNGKICRYSDASRAAYADGANQGLGAIARTSGPNNGSLEIVGSFAITSSDLSRAVAVGQGVDKVGRTTGWTHGTVSNTCVNTGVQGSRIVQLCQTFVTSSATIVLGGDSGSGTFQITSGTNVKLVGILWGGNGSGTQFVYSPLQNVVQELGALTVF